MREEHEAFHERLVESAREAGFEVRETDSGEPA